MNDAPAERTTRRYFLDWLRVLAFSALIIFHIGMLSVSWHYNLKSAKGGAARRQTEKKHFSP